VRADRLLAMQTKRGLGWPASEGGEGCAHGEAADAAEQVRRNRLVVMVTDAELAAIQTLAAKRGVAARNDAHEVLTHARGAGLDVTLVPRSVPITDTARRRPIEGGVGYLSRRDRPSCAILRSRILGAPADSMRRAFRAEGSTGIRELMIELRARYFGDWLRGGRR